MERRVRLSKITKNNKNKDNPGEQPWYKLQAFCSALSPLSKLGGGRYAVMEHCAVMAPAPLAPRSTGSVTSEQGNAVVSSLRLGPFYLRILCASILRFWLLEHTTATRSGWLGIAVLP